MNSTKIYKKYWKRLLISLDRWLWHWPSVFHITLEDVRWKRACLKFAVSNHEFPIELRLSLKRPRSIIPHCSAASSILYEVKWPAYFINYLAIYKISIVLYSSVMKEASFIYICERIKTLFITSRDARLSMVNMANFTWLKYQPSYTYLVAKCYKMHK